jgi:nucleoside-diphosphate kinase
MSPTLVASSTPTVVAGNTAAKSLSTASRGDDGEPYVFNCDYYDPHADLVRRYIVSVLPELALGQTAVSVEMQDPRLRRIFLRRTLCPNIALRDFSLGHCVMVFGRALMVQGYADNHTAQRLGPAAAAVKAAIASASTYLIPADVFFCASSDALTAILSPPLVATRLLRSKAHQKNSTECLCVLLRTASKSLERHHSSLDIKNYLSTDLISSDAFENIMSFPRPSKHVDTQSTTLLVIKPHAVRDGFAGQIITMLRDSGFFIVDMQSFNLSRGDSDDFLEVYRGVIPDYQVHVYICKNIFVYSCKCEYIPCNIF